MSWLAAVRRFGLENDSFPRGEETVEDAPLENPGDEQQEDDLDEKSELLSDDGE